MATDKFIPGDLVLVTGLVKYPGYWPGQISTIMSKNWRKVVYFGGGEEIGKAHVQVIRDYDEATKDDLEEFIPKKKMDKDPVLKQAVKQINQKLTGKKMKIRGIGTATRSEMKKMSDKKETAGKQKSQKISKKKEMTAAINETRKTRGKAFIGTNNETKKTTVRGELEKKKLAQKKTFTGIRNKTKRIPGINKLISTTKEKDRKKTSARRLKAGESDLRGSDGLTNDYPEYEQSRPNNEVQLANNNTDSFENINSHLLLNGGSSSSNGNLETSPTRLGSISPNNNLEVSSSGAIDNTNRDSCGVSVSTPISQSTSVIKNHVVADDVDIFIKCEVDEDANNNSDTLGTEDPSNPTTAEDAVDISTQEAAASGSEASKENSGSLSSEDISAQAATTASISASSGNSGALSTEDISTQEAAAAGSEASKENSGSLSTEGEEATAPGSSASSEDKRGASSKEGISANNLGGPQHNTEDTVRLNISMQMTPNTFSQMSPALLAFVRQPNVTVHINVPH